MKDIILPEDYNYIGVFLTFACQYNCSYCINKHGLLELNRRHMSKEDWIYGLSRIKSQVPITFQGGEPTLYKGFYELLEGLPKGMSLDLLTNLEISVEDFSRIPITKFKREAPYASIRVSYHNEQSDFLSILHKVTTLQSMGYSIGVFEVDHPAYHQDVIARRLIAVDAGLDWRIKEFLGMWKGKLYGTFKYPQAVNSRFLRHCTCYTTELLFDPAGNAFRCHSDLYANRCSIGNIFDKDLTEKLGRGKWCGVYGKCNACDIKIKNDRFQVFGHSSVRIEDICEPYADNKEITNGHES